MTAAQPDMSHESAEMVGSVRRKGRVDQVIETLASGLGNSVAWLAENGVLFAIFALIWIAFAAGLILSQGSLDQAWQTIRGLPLIVQAVVWLVFLPVMVGLWVWETTWPLIVRLVLVAGIAGWNLMIFLPRAAQAARP
jgi:ABC-type amino acid transport system permease subunit